MTNTKQYFEGNEEEKADANTATAITPSTTNQQQSFLITQQQFFSVFNDVSRRRLRCCCCCRSFNRKKDHILYVHYAGVLLGCPRSGSSYLFFLASARYLPAWY